MQHESDPQTATALASEVRAFVTSFGAECEVLPASDRVVVHLALSEARHLVTGARMRGMRIPHEKPQQLSLFDADRYLVPAN